MLLFRRSEDTGLLKQILNKLRNHTCANERCLEQDVSLIILIYFGFLRFLAHSFVYWHNKWLTLPLVGRARRSCQETQVLVEFYRAVWNALNTVFSLQQ